MTPDQVKNWKKVLKTRIDKALYEEWDYSTGGDRNLFQASMERSYGFLDSVGEEIPTNISERDFLETHCIPYFGARYNVLLPAWNSPEQDVMLIQFMYSCLQKSLRDV